MKPRVFAAFVAPSLALMVLFIAVPLVFVFVQSLYLTQTVFEQVEVEICTPGFLGQNCVTEIRTRPKLDSEGRTATITKFAGFDAYRAVLATDRFAEAFAPGGGGWAAVLEVDFYRALRFTLTFSLITLPLVVGLGLVLALAVDSAVRAIRGPLIFVNLLPFIITPVIGALSIRWLFIGDGVAAQAARFLAGQDIAFFAQGWTIEILMLFYRVWHVTPFAFVVFYAGLQTVDADTLESAIIDGASRVQRLRYVIVPHLMPLIVFVSLIHLMDAYRVFEEVVGFASQAYRISLQFLTYQLLTPDMVGNRAVARASASAMLTMIGIVILLIPVLRRAWRDHRIAR